MYVLLVDDDADIVALMYEHLESKGHVVDSASDGQMALNLARQNKYDVIVLDRIMPGMDGIALCERIRKEIRKSTPILMLTVRGSVEDKLTGFDAGADDYLAKPFSVLELEARLNALARRGQDQTDLLEVADLKLNLDTLEVERDGNPINLAPIGIRLLELLMRASPKVVTRREIEIAIWRDEPPDSDALRAHIYALRNAIDKPFGGKLLRTVHGIGYRLVTANDAP